MITKAKPPAGIFQCQDGNWGYRFKVTMNGKTVDKRRVTDDEGNPFRSMNAAKRARQAAIIQAAIPA